MNKKTFIIFILVVLVSSCFQIKKIKLNADIENPTECYIKAITSLKKINECSTALLEKEIEIIEEFKVK